jgi:DNA-binding IclR family transcriptional regulator
MRGVAAPVHDSSGLVVSAVGLAGPIQRLTKRDLRAFVPQVVSTADAVSARLGYGAR